MTDTTHQQRLASTPYRQEAIDAYLAGGRAEATNPLRGSRLPWLFFVVAAAFVLAVGAASVIHVTESTSGTANVAEGSREGVVFVPIGAAASLRTGQRVTLDGASGRVVAVAGPIGSDTAAARIALDAPAVRSIDEGPATVELARPTILELLDPGRWLDIGGNDG